MFNSYEYQELFLRSAEERRTLASFLAEQGIALDTLDCYIGIFDGTKLIGGGGYKGNIIKCVAVCEQYRSEQLTNGLITHLRSCVLANGYQNTFVFTKPENEKIFRSLAFYTVGRSPNAILLESERNGISNYCNYLNKRATKGNNGVIIANCNPFTNGHRYLIERAASQVEQLHVIVVAEEQQPFTYAQRLDLVKKGVQALPNVIVHEGSPYIISQATFPSYFIKDASTVAANQIKLDLDVFATHVAPSLYSTVRFVGSEPIDLATAQYNAIMQEVLPSAGVRVCQIERLQQGKSVVSASRVRQLLQEGNFDEISTLVPPTTLSFLQNEYNK